MERDSKMKVKDLVTKVLEGDMYGIARATRYVEDELKGYKSLLKKLDKHAGKAHIVGITGFPGSGKSTLIRCLIQEYISLGKKVGVVAVDPTSLSGGALLGDRTRMKVDGLDPFDNRVYIRSMASRGHSGGLAKSTGYVVKILDAAGYDKIFVETVGAGQNDIEIMNLAHTSIVVVTPGMGDVQMLKGGIMEIADLYVVNKADNPESFRTESEIKDLIRLLTDHDWVPKVYKTEAYRSKGIKELVDGIEGHCAYRKEKSAD